MQVRGNTMHVARALGGIGPEASTVMMSEGVGAEGSPVERTKRDRSPRAVRAVWVPEYREYWISGSGISMLRVLM